jgi:hypothetical protein
LTDYLRIYNNNTGKGGGDYQKAEAARIAIRAIGIKGVPWLVRSIAIRPGKFNQQYADNIDGLCDHLPLVSVHFLSYTERLKLNWVYLSITHDQIDQAPVGLLRLLKNPSSAVRLEAVRALAFFVKSDQGARDALQESEADADENVREAAVFVLEHYEH